MTGTATDGSAVLDRRPRAVDPHPRLRGVRVSDLSAGAGAAVWGAVVVGARTGATDLSTVALYAAFAALVLVPLGLGLVGAVRLPQATAEPETGAIGRGLRADPWYAAAVVVQFPGALALVGSLAAPRGSTAAVALALPWLFVTGAMAVHGARRLLARGPRPTHALAIDAALLYAPVAAAFLLLDATGRTLGFAPIVVLLTVVHFHYAGFVLPLVAGLAGRIAADPDRSATGASRADRPSRPWTAATLLILGGVPAVAVGIALSALLEVVAVAIFAVGLLGFAALVARDVAPAVRTVPGALLGVAAVSITWGTALALLFAYSAHPATSPILSIPEMVRWHGTANALGFALPALLAFRLLDAGG